MSSSLQQWMWFLRLIVEGEMVSEFEGLELRAALLSVVTAGCFEKSVFVELWIRRPQAVSKRHAQGSELGLRDFVFFLEGLEGFCNEFKVLARHWGCYIL
jgi:hypothetical protein